VKHIVILFPLLIIILTGCNNANSNDLKLTEEKAKQIVIAERSRECCNLEIVSITSKPNKYVVEWEIASIEEKGKDSIHKKTGEIKMIDLSLGTCQWK